MFIIIENRWFAFKKKANEVRQQKPIYLKLLDDVEVSK